MSKFVNRWSHLPEGNKVKNLFQSLIWSNTILGKEPEWPENLSTTLSLILESPLPMCIFWGNKLVQFFNDPYYDSIGDLVAKKGFANSPENTFGEKWPVVSSILQRVMEGENVKFSDYSLGIKRPENERYYDFSYSPIRNLNGEVVGVLMVAVEIPERINIVENLLVPKLPDRKENEQTSKALRSIVENAPFPIAVFEGQDLIITLANQFMLNFWGKGNDVLGNSFRTILPESENQIFDQINHVFSSGFPIQSKYQRINILKEGKVQPYYFNYGLMPLYNEMGEVYAVMNTACELTDIQSPEFMVEKEEMRFKDLMKQANIGIVVLRDDDYLVEMASHNFLQLVGKTEEELVGRPLFKSLPRFKELTENILLEIKEKGESFYKNEFPVTLQKNGKSEQVFLNFVYHPIKGGTGKFSGIMIITTEVTDSVRVKHELQQSENHFKNMVMQSPVPMAILTGEKHRVEWANNAMIQTVWRKKPSDVLGISILDAFPELIDQKYPNLLRKVYNSGTIHREKESMAVVYGDDGVKQFYLDFEYAPIFDTGNEISGIMITANDVTDKVEAKLKIQENEERLNMLISESDLGVWEYDLLKNGSLIYSRCNEIFGFPGHDNISNDQLKKRFHPDDLDMIKKAYEQSYITGHLNYECRIIWENKSLHWIEVKGRGIFDDSGNPERIVGTIRDITKEKYVKKQFVESQEKFKFLADFMPQMVWTSDNTGLHNYFNNAVFEFSGMPLQDLYGEGLLKMVHPADRNLCIEKWTHSVLTGEDFYLEHRLKSADGTYSWQISRAKPQRDDQGNIIMWVGSSTDIDEQKVFIDKLANQIENRTKELNQKNIELEKIKKEMQSFAYISSHDLQEPLRKIQTFVSFLLEGEYENLTGSGKDIFSRMQKSVHRMQILIQDLLTYSRTNTQDKVFDVVNFDAIAGEVLNDLKEEMHCQGAHVKIQSSCDVYVIPNQFKQIISNLISNSIKFAHVDRKPVIIMTCENIEGIDVPNNPLVKFQSYTHISISDNGIGFDPIYKERIFEIFQRLHGKSEYGGSGMGLAVVKKIVDNHQGLIKATGEPGKGSRFDIYLPRLNP